MPLISRSEILKKANYIAMRVQLDALHEEARDSPITKHAIKDVKEYVNDSLINETSLYIEESILQARICECHAFITMITNARAKGWEEGKNILENYYLITKDKVESGYFPSDLKKILSSTYDKLSGKFSVRHARTDESLSSIEDPLTAFFYIELKESMERIQNCLNELENQDIDNEVVCTILVINEYLRTLTGEVQNKFKDNFGIASEILQLRLSKLQELALVVERYLNAPIDDQLAPAFIICPISHNVMTEPVVIDSGHTYDRVSIRTWFDGLRATGYPLTCPMTRQVVQDNLIPNFTLKQAIQDSAKNNTIGRFYFLSQIENHLDNLTHETKPGIWGSNLKDLLDGKTLVHGDTNFNNGFPLPPGPDHLNMRGI